jgi:hypothetical protein
VSWRATARLYSGRPNPEWDVDDELATRFDALPPLEGNPPPPAPPLGYRGVALVAGDGTLIEAWGGAVTRGGRELRADPGREFERAVLASAPPGAVP